jgi:hypothetical protein
LELHKAIQHHRGQMQKKTKNLEININDEMLDNIASVLKSNAYTKMGVLGKSSQRSEAGPSNTELAATHEFGKGNVPQRSFLRLTAHTAKDKFQEFIDASANGIFKSILENRWLNTLDLFGAKWVEYIQDTFDAQGFGEWPPLSIITLLRRKNPKNIKSIKKLRETTKMLEDTGALRRSIMHEVVSK